MSKGNSSKPAVAVIGAGMGGMATAARLAKAGHQVDKSVLYELSDQGMLFFDDQRWSARLSLVHACHIAAFEAVDW